MMRAEAAMIEQACAAVHGTLAQLPRHTSPKGLPFQDGLYFFYEDGEVSDHAPDGRVVRVGNHPRSDRGLARRLTNHYIGRKNSSVFRKFMGGALLRKQDRHSACLDHWEKQDAPVCPACRPIEDKVSALIRDKFFFRCVAIPSMADRNRLEALLVATLAACRVCRPSSSWLGLNAYSAKVQMSGLWNSQYVGGLVIDMRSLDRFIELAGRSPTWAKAHV